MTAPRSRVAYGLWIGAAVAALVVWVLSRRSEPEQDRQEEAAVEDPPERAAPPTPPPRPPPPPPAVAVPGTEEHVADDGLPFMPPGANDPRPDGPVHPHPITPEHQRIFAENRLIGALDGAMDVEDPAGMRRLLEQYRREYPEDANDLQEGYAVVIDCLEKPGPGARDAALRWAERHRGSTLRRHVSRHCIEPTP